MKLSLVVTVRNEAADAAQLIEDVLAQTRPPDEWILVDGGSTDGTAQIFEDAGRYSGGCQVVRFPGNIAQGRNHGVERATGDVIAMTDAQCRLEVDWLESLAAPFDRNDVEEPVDYLGGPTRPQLDRPFDVVQWTLLDQLNFEADRRRSPLFSCRNLAFRRSVWQRCPFPEWLDHGEDAWVFDRWQREGFRAWRAKVKAVVWRQRPDLRSFWLQHFRYMRGDGRARLRLRTHALRLGFYLALLLLLVFAAVAPSWWALYVAAGAWTLYLLLNTIRLFQVLARSGRMRWWWRCAALLPAMLIVLDAAKTTGFLSGLATSLDRGRAEARALTG